MGFYAAVIGWTFVTVEIPACVLMPEGGTYSLAMAGDGNIVCGIGVLPDGAEHPAAWHVYFQVEDADATSAAIEAAGGTVLQPVFDVMTEGRMGFFADPTGAAFGIWQPLDHKGATAQGMGQFVWHEVATRDPQSAATFYSTVFGVTADAMEIPEGAAGEGEGGYWMLMDGEEMVSGILEITADFPAEVPNHWSSYFLVADTDAAVAAALELGGTVVHEAIDSPYGRFALLVDPYGAKFAVIQPPAEDESTEATEGNEGGE
jgi:predicted enzyme related to lactoylglutathione lyase